MKQLIPFLLVLTIFSCSKVEPNMAVTGQIKGLKKGTLYLQQLKDTMLVVLDSVIYNGEDNYVLTNDLKAPEMLYLTLDKNAGDDIPRISFFAVPGMITINSTLKRFEFDAKVMGSPLNKKLEEFKSINSRFNDQNLELIKAKFDAQKSGNDTLLSQLKKDSDNLMRRKYLYAINFAMNNKDSEIAPYIALSEIYNAKVTFLDTIYNALSNNIANSKYGLQLEEFIQERKKEDSIK